MFVIWTTRMRNNLNDCYLINKLAFFEWIRVPCFWSFRKNHGHVIYLQKSTATSGTNFTFCSLVFFPDTTSQLMGWVASLPKQPRLCLPLPNLCCGGVVLGQWEMVAMAQAKHEKTTVVFATVCRENVLEKRALFRTNLTRGFFQDGGMSRGWV